MIDRFMLYFWNTATNSVCGKSFDRQSNDILYDWEMLNAASTVKVRLSFYSLFGDYSMKLGDYLDEFWLNTRKPPTKVFFLEPSIFLQIQIFVIFSHKRKFINLVIFRFKMSTQNFFFLKWFFRNWNLYNP